MSTAPTEPDAFADALAEAVTPAAYLDAAHRAVVRAATLAPSVHNSQPWLRLGYAAGTASTPRRHVDDVLSTS